MRRSRIKPVNRKRLAERRALQFGPQADLCRELPCCICGVDPPSDPAHIRSRGANGKDRGNVLPMCRLCHGHQEAHGWSGFGVTKDEMLAWALAKAKDIEQQAYGGTNDHSSSERENHHGGQGGSGDQVRPTPPARS